MKKYNFIKISNNNNPSQDFFIDITTMLSVTLRMQILKSQMLKHQKTGGGLYRPAWYYIQTVDYSYYKIDTQEFENYNDAKAHSVKIYNEQFIKMNKDNPPNLIKNKNIITFD